MLQAMDGAFYRRLAVTAATLAIFRLGCHLPLPGLSPTAFVDLYGGLEPAVEPVSIFALGIWPLVDVLILVELAKTLFPSWRRWALAEPANGANLGWAIILVALGATAVQTIGYAGALEDVTRLIAQPGLWFRITISITLVGATALLIVMARLIDRDGWATAFGCCFLPPFLSPCRSASSHSTSS